MKADNCVDEGESGKSEFHVVNNPQLMREKPHRNEGISLINCGFTVFRCGRTSTNETECSGSLIEISHGLEDSYSLFFSQVSTNSIV